MSGGTQKSVVRWLLVGLAIGVGGVIYWLMPDGVGELPRRAGAILGLAAVLWATEAVPLFATSFCVVALEILLLARHGGLAEVGDLHFERFLAPFASEIVVLFLGGFLLSAAVSKHGVDRVIAARVLGPLTNRPAAMMLGVLAMTAFASMWMSNTATTALMLALLAPVIRDLPVDHKFNTGLILAVPVGANIGGIGTPVGTPPNAIALGALRKAGYSVSFVDWTLLGVPIVAALILVSAAVLYGLYRPPPGTTLRRIEPPTKIGLKGKMTAVVLLATIGGWLTGPWHGVGAAVVAMAAAGFLAVLGLLDGRDVDGIEWNILILMWGGLSLGEAMESTGLLDLVKQLPFDGLPAWALVAGALGITVGMSTFISNTVTANLMIPLVLTLGRGEAVTMAVMTALACSVAMAMPISTPPNAMAYATGRLRVGPMLAVGSLIGLAGVVLLLGIYRVIAWWVEGLAVVPSVAVGG